MTVMSAHLVRLNDALLVRGGTQIFSDLSLTVEGGQRLAIIGPNGVGKTSLSMVLSGRLRLSKGEIELLGHDVRRTDIRTLRPKIGYFSDELAPRLGPEMTALQAVALGRYSGLRSEWFSLTPADLLEADRLLQLVELSDARDRTLESLSSGQRQRVLLARAFCGTPQLTVLDEPTSHLDLVARELMIVALERILGEHHRDGALIMVAHHLEDLPSSITHVLVLAQERHWFGPIHEVLTAQTLTEAYQHPIEVHSLAGRRIATAKTHPA